MAVTWQNKWKWHTGYSADSVEWCPVESYHNILVCGTYQLDKKEDQPVKQKRLGKIYLFIIDEHTTDLKPTQTIEIAGVLDQKWSYHLIENLPTLAVVISEGSLQLYQLYKDENLELKLWLNHSFDKDILALSVDWSTNKINEVPMLVVSDSKGIVHVLKIDEGSLKEIEAWNAHGFEAWIAAFDYWNNSVFYTGGDDCTFKCFDIRTPNLPTAVNKSHEAGVTSIRSHINIEHRLVTGSYDEKVRLWDTRQLKHCVTETNAKGGVWRLKWHPHKTDTVLAACMYGGFRILKVEHLVHEVGEYLEHESIAYGADWKVGESGLVATCSFYDCMMHVSKVSL